jgi:hypothetical protein
VAGPRIRTLKPEILDDEKIAPLSDSAFRLFTSFVVLADDYGNARADIRWLQGQIWWAHGEPPNILTALIELYRATLIEVYAVRGGTYVHLKGWEKHQRIDNAGKNRVPTPKDADVIAIVADTEIVAAVRGESPRLAAGPRPGMGEEREMEAAASPPPAKPKKSAKSETAIPTDWTPRTEERSRAAVSGLDCDSEAEHFRDHHTARNSRFADWDAAFRTWLRNAVKFSAGRQGSLLGPAQPPQRKIEKL